MMEYVSIIVPVYNSEKTLKESIDTVLNQTYQNLEVIIIDDGSTDKTAAIADCIQEKDNRVKVYHIENAGVSNARNIGLQCCSGQYVVFMDADDAMDKNMIEKLASEINPAIDLVCCGYKIVTPEGKLLFSQNPMEGDWDFSKYYEAIGILQESKAFNVLWNKIFKKSIIDNYNIKMDISLSMGEDFLFVIDYLKHIKNLIRIYQDDLYHYTLSVNGLQAKKNDNNNLDRRLQQLSSLKSYYVINKYPLDTIYMEILRCFYISLSETQDLYSILDVIYQRDEFNELISKQIVCGKKYSLFIKTLKTKNYYLIKCLIYLFKEVKQISGKSYKWK